MSILNKISTIPALSKLEHSDEITSLDSRLAVRKKKLEESELSGFSGYPYVLSNTTEILQGQLSLKNERTLRESGKTTFTESSSKKMESVTDDNFFNLSANNFFLNKKKLLTGKAKPENNLLTELKNTHKNEHTIIANCLLKNERAKQESGKTTVTENNSNKIESVTDDNFFNLSDKEFFLNGKNLLAGKIEPEINLLTESKNTHEYEHTSMVTGILENDSEIYQDKIHFLDSEFCIKDKVSGKRYKNKSTHNNFTFEMLPISGNQYDVKDLNINIQTLNENFISRENQIFKQLNTLQQMVMNMSNPVLQGLIYRFNLRNYQKEYVVVTKDHYGKYTFDSSSKNVFSLLSTNSKSLNLNNWILKYKGNSTHSE